MFSLICASLLNSLEKIIIYRNFRYFDLNKYKKTISCSSKDILK